MEEPHSIAEVEETLRWGRGLLMVVMFVALVCFALIPHGGSSMARFLLGVGTRIQHLIAATL